jgi:hypothetical protein
MKGNVIYASARLQKEAAMSILSKFTHCALAAFLTFGVASPASQVVAQTSSAIRTSSVLSTGGGAALLDPSDAVILLLDHQTGLFQTVKDISVAELRTNTIHDRQACYTFENSSDHNSLRAKWPNGPLMPEIQQFAPHTTGRIP